MSSSSSSSSSSIGNLQTSSLVRFTGANLMSGLDTDGIIKALTAGTQSKIDKQKQLEQIAQWKRDMYRDVTTSLKTFSSTYFSYTNPSNNILSSSFFNSTSITSSSSAVSAIGNATNAKNMIINSISQLATAAAYNSSQKVSNGAITSGTVYDSWAKSNVGGKSVVVSYDGKDYTLTLSNSVMLDSHNTDPDGKLASSEVQKIVSGLNDQLDGNDLKGKVAFNYDPSSGKISLAATDATKSVGLKAYQPTTSDTADPAFFAQLGFSAAVTGTGSISAMNEVNRSLSDISATSLFSHSISSTSRLTFSYGDENYTLNLGTNIDTAGVSDQKLILQSIADQLNKQINTAGSSSPYKDLAGKISFTVTGTGSDARMTVNNMGSQALSITGGSQNFQNAFGLGSTPISVASGANYTTTDANIADLTTTYLGDALQGSTLTFNLDGLKKNITFDAAKEAQYETVGNSGSGLVKYLQDQVNNTFGNGKITVNASDAGGISFKVTDPASVLSLTSSDNINVLNKNSALRISSGDSNRIETSKTLQELSTDAGGAGEFGQKLQAGSDGTYKITINGQTLSFSGTDTVGDVMTKINDNSAAGVTVSYSQTTDTFRIVSSDTGSQGRVKVADATSGGNLAEVLFGTETSSLSDAETGAITADHSGKIVDTSDSKYVFTLDGNAAQTITIAAPQSGSFASITDLATAVQKQIDDNSTLNGKIDIGIKGNQLTFNSTDGSALTVGHSSGTGDVLNVTHSGTLTGISTVTASEAGEALATLQSAHPDVITKGSDGKYYVAGSGYDGSQTLQSIITAMNSNITANTSGGKDLMMSVSLNGSSTPTAITRSSNSFVLDGVTVTANSTTTNSDGSINTNAGIKFSSTTSTDDIYKKITDFVTAYNALITKVHTYTTDTPERNNDHKLKYQPLTDDQKKDMSSDEIDKWNTQAKKGLLQNDNTLNGIVSDLNTTMNTIETSSGLSLSQIGISTVPYDYTSGGQLSINPTALKSALSTQPDKVDELFTNATDGIATKLTNVMDRYAGTSGGKGTLIALAGTDTTVNDQSQMTTQINQYESNVSDLKSQLQTQQDRWWSKFTAMEQSLSRLNSQMGYLNSMNGSSSSS